MENKDLYNPKSNTALVSDTENLKAILRDPKETQSYNSTRGELFSSDKLADLSDQASVVETDRDRGVSMFFLNRGAATIAGSYRSQETRHHCTEK